MIKYNNSDVVDVLDRYLNYDSKHDNVIITDNMNVEQLGLLNVHAAAGNVKQIIPGVVVLTASFPRDQSEPLDIKSSSRNPAPYSLAAAICNVRGWKMALPFSFARYLLGMAELPQTNEVDCIPFDQRSSLSFKKYVYFEPGAAELFGGVSIAGQALIQAVPQDLSVEQLKSIGETAGHCLMAEPEFLNMLRMDINLGHLNGRERYLAQVIIDTAAQNEATALRKAPEDFVPPSHAPFLNGWAIDWRFGMECLSAASTIGHPGIEDRSPLPYTSPLVWIDADIGWAKTQNRWYRLGQSLPWNSAGRLN